MVCLVRPEIEKLNTHIDEVRSVCTDLGVEHGLTSLCTPVSSLVPQWYGGVTASCMEPDLNSEASGLMEADVGSEVEEACAPKSQKFLPFAVPVAGLEHITNNLTEEVHVRLAWWETFYAKLHNLSLLLTHRWRRERFLHHCLQGTPLAVRAHELEGWSASLYQARWHHVIIFVRKMLPIWALLRCFTASGYVGDSGGGQHDSRTMAHFDAAEAEKTVRSQMFYTYCHFVCALDDVPHELAAWSKGCACHGFLRRASAPGVRDRGFRLHFGNAGGSQEVCPLQGKRAGEMATGKMEKVLAKVVDNMLWKLLTHQGAVAYSDEEVHLLVADCDAARAHLELQLRVKLDYWHRVPWILCGLAHWNEDEGRECARIAVSAINSFSLSAFDAVTQRWASPPLVQELQKFAQGMAFSQCSSFFQEEAVALYLAPVNETCIESKHARATKAVAGASNAGPVTVSLANRWPPVHKELATELSKQGPLHRLSAATHSPSLQQCQLLLEAFTTARKLPVACIKLGIQQQPLIQRALLRMNWAKEHRKWDLSEDAAQVERAPGRNSLVMGLKCALYRTDLPSMFQDMQEQHRGHRKQKLQEHAQQHRAVLGGAALQLQTASTYEDLLQKFLLQHFRTVANQSHYYSILVNVADTREGVGGEAFQLLSEYFAKDTRTTGLTASASAMVDSDTVEQVPVFFKVLKTNPSQQKQIPVSLGARNRLQAQHIAVMLFRPIIYDLAGRAVLGQKCGEVSSTSHGSAAVALLSGMSLSPSLRKWELEQITFATSDDDIGSSTERVLTNVVKGRAVPSTHDAEASLLSLEVAGVIQRQRDPFLEGWVLCNAAFSQLRQHLHLHKPSPALSVREVDPAEMTLYELVKTLEGQGFSWQLAPQRVAARHRLTPFHRGGTKMWYSRGPQVLPQYLLCLLRAEET